MQLTKERRAATYARALLSAQKSVGVLTASHHAAAALSHSFVEVRTIVPQYLVFNKFRSAMASTKCSKVRN